VKDYRAKIGDILLLEDERILTVVELDVNETGELFYTKEHSNWPYSYVDVVDFERKNG
jgi:hypothetical protein